MDTLMKASLLLGTYRRPILSDDDSRRREAVDAKADTCHISQTKCFFSRRRSRNRTEAKKGLGVSHAAGKLRIARVKAKTFFGRWTESKLAKCRGKIALLQQPAFSHSLTPCLISKSNFASGAGSWKMHFFISTPSPLTYPSPHGVLNSIMKHRGLLIFALKCLQRGSA